MDIHLSTAHRAHLEWMPQRLIEWGRQIGQACGELITRLLQTYKHPEHGYRSCLGLLSLSRRNGKERLEAACVEFCIKHSFTRPYRPQTNSKAQQFIQSTLRE